jgi:hypothetical protein
MVGEVQAGEATSDLVGLPVGELQGAGIIRHDREHEGAVRRLADFVDRAARTAGPTISAPANGDARWLA